MISRRAMLLSALLLPIGTAAAQVPGVRPAGAPGGRKPLLVAGKHELYQRIITRPGATLTPQPGAAGAQPTPGFMVYYVYQRNDQWLEVGSAADGRTQGWLPATHAIDWKHTLIGAFTNPAGRQPVLFLDSHANAQRLILDGNAAATVQRLRQDVAAGRPGSVVAMEPANFVDIDSPGHFYLLPILSAELIEREIGGPVRLLEVVSVPSVDPPPAIPDRLKDFKASLVFLIDTTMSMQPYIDATREAVTAIVHRIGGTALKDKFRFGIVAYRDSLLDTPDLEYPIKVFATPDFTAPPDAVLHAMNDVREATASSIGFDEDPIGGVQATLDQIDWSMATPNGGRYILLITDSGARTADNPHSVTHLNIPEIRVAADGKKVQIMAVHLLTAEGARRHDHERASQQYRELTQTNAAGSLYYGVANGDRQAFTRTVSDLVNDLLIQIAAATGVPPETLRLPPSSADTPEQARMRDQMRVVGEAMRLANLGRIEQTQAPDVQRSFTADRDLANSDVAALNVRVLLTRNQLADLYQALKTIMEAGKAGRTEPQNFFTQLRSTFASFTTDPQQISQITSAHNIGAMIAEYLDDLPYRSQILTVSEEDWLAMGSISQREILNNIDAKLRLYQEFQEHSALWHDITHTNIPGEAVYPVPIEALP
ncbi:MAG: VWA domain-containing protein [Azospirillaceae bacterium]|nr:VWA domain-containing protein [Azospirillaceae bacterium]